MDLEVNEKERMEVVEKNDVYQICSVREVEHQRGTKGNWIQPWKKRRRKYKGELNLNEKRNLPDVLKKRKELPPVVENAE